MRILIFLLLILFLATGCCKVLCVEEFIGARFVNFERTDIDTVVTRLYHPNTNFSNPIDSATILFGTATMDTVYISLFDKIDFSKDIEVYLPSTGDKYQITDIHSRRQRCACGQSTKIITSYTLDGVQYTGEEIFLVKR